MKPTLKVFITENCPGCDEALSIATRVEQNYADRITVEVIDIVKAEQIVPEAVFATPTFMLNGRIVSLGNPSPQEVSQWISDVATVQPEP